MTACADDVRLAFGMRLNLMLLGPRARVEPVLAAIAPTLVRPVVVWHPGTTLLLPALPRRGTLLVRDVNRLGPGDQLRLHRWLTNGGRPPQVISTCSEQLLPSVLDGRFLEGLFYRLNTVCVSMQ